MTLHRPVSDLSIEARLAQAQADLAPANFENPRVEAEAILSGLLGCARSSLHLRRSDALAPDLASRFETAIQRRLRREPVAYILGDVVFDGLRLQVDRRVLVPRPETELLVEEAAALSRRVAGPAPRILEIGTGSGCIAAALARRLSHATVLATDLSSDALDLARTNIRNLGLEDRVSFAQADVYEGLPAGRRSDFDMIVSNPPYISSPEMATLEKDLSYEPRLALEAGPDGLAVLERIVDGAGAWLREPGAVALEIGHRQGTALAERLGGRAFLEIAIKSDWNGHSRIVTGVTSGSI